MDQRSIFVDDINACLAARSARSACLRGPHSFDTADAAMSRRIAPARLSSATRRGIRCPPVIRLTEPHADLSRGSHVPLEPLSSIFVQPHSVQMTSGITQAVPPPEALVT